MQFVDTMTVTDLLGTFGIGTSGDASSASAPGGLGGRRRGTEYVGSAALVEVPVLGGCIPSA